MDADAVVLQAGPDWRIVSTIHDHGWFVLARDPKVRELADLRGKTLGVSFGALVQYTAIRQFRRLGIERDVKLINIDAGSLVNAMEEKSIDGIIVWQGPVSSAILSRKLGHALPLPEGEQILTAIQALSGEFMRKYPDASVAFLKALTMAFSYASKNREQVIDWYLQDHPQIRLPRTEIAANWAADRHLRRPTEIRDVDLRLKKANLEFGQGIADMVHGLRLLPRFSVVELTRLELMERAFREIQEGKHPRLD